MKKIILLACIFLCSLNSYGQNEYELNLIGEWELYSVLVDASNDDSGNMHLKEIYDDSKPIVCVFKDDKTYFMKKEGKLLEEGSWSISNNGKKLTICKVNVDGEKSCESRKLHKGKHDYSEEEFNWFGEICLLADEKLASSSWSQSAFKRKEVDSLSQKLIKED